METARSKAITPSRVFRACANGSSASCWRGISRTGNGIPFRVDPVGRHVFASTQVLLERKL